VGDRSHDETGVGQRDGRVEMTENDPPVPCDITTSGRAVPCTSPFSATFIVVGSITMGWIVAWLGYQMRTSSGLPSGSAAKPR
jgi:hypothetical protein